MTANALPLSPELNARLAGVSRIIFLDIDGTLAPIAPRPEHAVVPSETLDVLATLAAQPATHVAVVSGRRAADARRLVPTDGTWVIGNHGIEVIDPAGAVRVDPSVWPFESVVAEAARRLEETTGAIVGVILEDKTWTLSVHYRLADRAVVPGLIEIVQGLSHELGLVTLTGKEVLELRPPVGIDKGTAVVEVARMLGAGSSSAIVFVGDDRTDEDAFRALRREWPRAITVRVVDENGGRPANDETAAEFVVATPCEVRDLLVALARISPSS
jgi:trehalose-phosphatase